MAELTDDEKIIIARQNGIVQANVAMKASRWTDVPYWATCTFLQKETNGGHNIYGHDPTFFVGFGIVTEDNYRVYKRLRSEFGNQGVGPMQLTAVEFQDAADKLGGCHIPLCNILAALEQIREWKLTKTWHEVATRFNGSPEYGDDWMIKGKLWQQRFRGTNRKSVSRH